MKSDLKKHRLLKILSDYRLEKNRLGISYEDLCSRLRIERKELNKLSAELINNEEIGLFNNGKDPKGLFAKKEGTSAYSSDKYRKRYINDNWALVRNWTILIGLIISVSVQFRYCQPNKEVANKQALQEDYIKDTEKTLSETKQTQESKQDTLVGNELENND